MGAANKSAEAAAGSSRRAAEHKFVKGAVKASDATWVQSAANKVKWTDEQVEELPVINQPAEMFADMVRRAEVRSKVKGYRFMSTR